MFFLFFERDELVNSETDGMWGRIAVSAAAITPVVALYVS